MAPPKAIVFLEGNIASGKTSLLQALSAYPKFTVVTEPVDLWQDSGMLKLFYDGNIDPQSFQAMVTSTHFAKSFTEIANAKHDEVIICERSLLIGTQAFAEVCIENASSRQAHNLSIKSLAELFPKVPTFYFYVDTPATVCMKRLKERNRPSEKNVTLSYLENVESSHRKLIKQFDAELTVMILDGSKARDLVLKDFFDLIDLKLNKKRK